MKVVKAMIPGTLCLLLLLLSGCVSSGMIDRLKGLEDLQRRFAALEATVSSIATPPAAAAGDR